jgi:hypothetical protein
MAPRFVHLILAKSGYSTRVQDAFSSAKGAATERDRLEAWERRRSDTLFVTEYEVMKVEVRR